MLRREKEVMRREKEKASSNPTGGTTGVMGGIRPGKQGTVEKSSEGLRFREEEEEEEQASGAIPATSSFTSVVDLGPPVLPLPLPMPVEQQGRAGVQDGPAAGDGRGEKEKSWKSVESPEAVGTTPSTLDDNNSASGIELATFSQSSPVNTAPGASTGAGAGAGAGPKTPKKDKRDRSPNSSPLHSRDRDRHTNTNLNPTHPVATSLSNTNASAGANANASANAPRLKAKSPSMNMLQRATSVLGGVGKKGDDKDKDKDKEKDKNGMNEKGDLDSSNSREEKKAGIGGGGGGASTGKLNSPSKLKKPISGAGMKGLAATTLSKSESEGEGLLATFTSLGAGGGGGSVLAGGHSPAVSASGSKTVTPGSSPQRKGLTPQETPRGVLRDTKDPLAGENTNGTNGGGGGGGNGNGNGKGKGGKKDSLWTTFRHLFYEDRRRGNKRQSVTPTSSSASPLVPSEVKLPAGVVVLSRGANSRTSHHKRSNVGYAASTGSRRTSLEGNRPVYSRRSSSIHTNSRRSSVGSLHFQDHQTMISDLSRRASQRSHGSQTPTSDREYLDFSSAAAAPLSRPGSSHSIRGGVGGGSRHSSFSVRSPSLNAETSSASTKFKSSVPPASPLLGYRRRPPGGNDSSRVRHIKVIPESQIMRSSSVASSIRSNPSSRASSMDRDRDRDSRESEYESGRDDVSSRSGRRQKKRNGSQRSLAQQIHRTRSPLALSLENTYSSNSVGSMGLGLGGTNRNPKKPLRDVFQKKGKRKDGDDEWVSEDEDEFACGLGQGRGVARRFSNSSGNGTVWMNVDSKANPARSAAAFPTSRMVSQSTPQGGGSRRRERGRKSSLEEERGRPQEGKGKVKGETVAQGLMGMESLSGRNRRNLPDRSTAPGIIEEEEEDEE